MTTGQKVWKFFEVLFELFGLVGVGIILWWMSGLSNQVNTVKQQQEADRAEIQPKLDSLVTYAKTSSARWDALGEFNPGKITVPRVVEVAAPVPSGGTRPPPQILIVRPTPTPAPCPTPRRAAPRPKHKASPTPAPFFQRWFNGGSRAR